MKLKVLISSLLFSAMGHASTYVCNEAQEGEGKTIAIVSLNKNGTASVQFDGSIMAYGQYSKKWASCPSRSCGDYEINLQAKVPNAPYMDVGNVHIRISQQGLSQFSSIALFYVGGRAPNVFSLECN
jgi:secreted trypsin-like serine protease